MRGRGTGKAKDGKDQAELRVEVKEWVEEATWWTCRLRPREQREKGPRHQRCGYSISRIYRDKFHCQCQRILHYVCHGSGARVRENPAWCFLDAGGPTSSLD